MANLSKTSSTKKRGTLLPIKRSGKQSEKLRRAFCMKNQDVLYWRRASFHLLKVNIMKNDLNLPDSQKLSEICKKYHIRRLSLFGSALRTNLQPDSDIDLLVEFEQAHIPGFFKLAQIEREFSTLFPKRRIDLRTPEDLSQYFRQDVLDNAESLYTET